MMTPQLVRGTIARIVLTVMVPMVCHASAAAQVTSTLEDFFQAGSQPNGDVVYDAFVSSLNCMRCHEKDGTTELVIAVPWQGSMMAQAARDPLFYAGLDIANADAASAGDLCIRCHTPGGWISGRSQPTDGSSLVSLDRDGVSCSVCHRMVDPVFRPSESPGLDELILAGIDPLPISPGGANYVLDPLDERRGPYSDLRGVGHIWLPSPFHRSAAICGTCHDVSNPVFQRQHDDTYTLTAVDQPHPTGSKYDMFPLERTYSEWLNSEFAATGVDMQGRFGGLTRVVSTCQDCHMPTTTGKGCNSFIAPVRDDLAAHEFAGGNAWVQDMVWNLYPDDGLTFDYLQAGKARSVSMLQRACSLDVTQVGNQLNVRITNETGHKLPTGYPEGRRMWINVQYRDAQQALIEERGGYNTVTADLVTENTKVYEVNLGLDPVVAAASLRPVGQGFHFALNNVILKDNRIPPRGFSNTAFRIVQAAPVGVTYADGQHWDDTGFRLPVHTRSAVVRVFYQTSSKEFITFLRDANPNAGTPDNAGQILYDQWELTGKSPPVMMAEAGIQIIPFATGDADGNQLVDLNDYRIYARDCESGPDRTFSNPSCASFDYDEDGDIDVWDFGQLMIGFSN